MGTCGSSENQSSQSKQAGRDKTEKDRTVLLHPQVLNSNVDIILPSEDNLENAAPSGKEGRVAKKGARKKRESIKC